MKLKWRKWFRVVHRDFGYLFFFMTVIYSLSGIALNHMREWNPNYIVTTYEFNLEDTDDINKEMSKEDVQQLLGRIADEDLYKNHYFPAADQLKIFLYGGSVNINTESGYGLFERSVRRPIFREVNYLHYNPIKSWTWFSDLFAGALIILAITGLFLVRGKKGITGRGAWLTIAGIVIPVVFLLIYFY